MVDIFALSITHGLLALAALRLVMRESLDVEGGARPRFGLRRRIVVTDEGAEDAAQDAAGDCGA